MSMTSVSGMKSMQNALSTARKVANAPKNAVEANKVATNAVVHSLPSVKAQSLPSSKGQKLNKIG